MHDTSTIGIFFNDTEYDKFNAIYNITYKPEDFR
ncbi:hypothetical protein SAMN05216357_115109 [Porphyromonadaceae bacterium KH3CP3RA]|nr:hypothetical protein SAMN05216357_115109 [Porphyromonadaceae bacterium KH3CP3RA]